jgi:CRISP-associated protein Cas1
MPLIRPADVLAAMDQPADLVIDAWGTWLGKRSERMVIRYRADVNWADANGAEDSSGEAAANWRDVSRTRGESTVSSNAARPNGIDDEVSDPEPSERGAVVVRSTSPSAHPALEPTDCNDRDSQDLGSGDDGTESSGDASSGDESVNVGEQASRSLLRLWRNDAVERSDWKRPSPQNRLRGQLDAAGADSEPERSRGGFEEKSVPISRLRSVTISGRGVTLSSDLIEALVEQGVGVSFIGWKGEPIAQLVAPGLSGTVQTRRSQLAAYETVLGVDLAVAFVRGKLRNQKHQLQYGGKYLKATAPERFERLTRKIEVLANLRKQLIGFKGDRLDAVRDRLMGHEGTGARVYWEGVAILLEGRIQFPGRVGRGAVDPVNSALNYGYSILYGRVSAAIANAGLEQFAGFLHVDRPGKPSLVLDLVEEFRAPIVDRVVLAMLNQGVVLVVDPDGRLTPPVRRQLADRVCERLDTAVPFEGKRFTLGQVIQIQARHLAVAVRGEREYRPFASRW